MTETKINHQPVLLNEVIEAIDLANCQIVVDGTLGLGGYSEAVLQNSKKVKVIAFELDGENLLVAQERLAVFGKRFDVVNDNFATLKASLADKGIEKVSAIMLDLGLSSPQVDVAERGFSFRQDGDLDMRFGKQQQTTAADLINFTDEKELARIFYEYGEERQSRRYAKAIVERRKIKKFSRTLDLADLISDLYKGKKGRIHPATQVFQAIRIAVNEELKSLQEVLNQSLEVLEEGGRLVVVAYHSLEDRLVKNFLRLNSKEFVNLPGELHTTILNPAFKIITKKPVVPSAQEIEENPRSRSAKLRVAVKI